MKTVKPAGQWASNWQRGMSGAGEKYKQGIQNYQGNPMQAAASEEAQALYRQRTAEASSSGRMAAALNAVPVDRWRSNAMNFGAANLTSGANKAKAKYEAKAQKLQAVAQAASNAANALPKTDSVGRWTAAYNVMKAAKGTI